MDRNLLQIALMLVGPLSIRTMADDSSVSAQVEEQMEDKVEKGHLLDSAFILMMIGLLVLTMLTIWLFKVRRFRYMHESGLCMIYGMIIGAIVKYSGGVSQTGYRLPTPLNGSKAPASLWVKTESGLSYSYSLKGLLYTTTTSQGDEFESKAVFDAEIFFYVLLPPIIFFAGYDMKKRFFFRNIGAILLYAFIGTTISCIVFGSMIYGYTRMIHSKIYEDFGFQKSLLFGSLISATDPVTVLAIFHDLHVDVDLYALVFGESVMNDAVAIVLYRSIDSYKSATFEAVSFFKAVGEFVGVFGGSFLIGCLMGLATALLTKLTNIKQFPLLETAVFALMSYSTFLIAEVAGLTGIVSVLFCGICQAHYTYNNLSPESQVATKSIFGLLNFLAENFIFSYMGLTVFTFSEHHWDPGFIAWSFLALAISRFCNIYPLSFLLNIGRSRKIGWNFQNMLMFAGLRGAVAFALAIRNTASVPRQLMLTTVLMVVLVTVIGNGGLTMRVLQYLNIRVGVNIEEEYGKDFVSVRTDSNDSNLQEETWYDRAFLTRHWHRFDVKYMKPLFTSKGPPIADALPAWCGPCVACVSKNNREHEARENTQTTDIDMDDELISIEGAVRPNSPEVILRPPDFKGRTVSEDQAADLGGGALRIRLDSVL